MQVKSLIERSVDEIKSALDKSRSGGFKPKIFVFEQVTLPSTYQQIKLK